MVVTSTSIILYNNPSNYKANAETLRNMCPNPGFADCNLVHSDQCETNILTNSQHCGACDIVCATGAMCIDGVCQCRTGQTACSGVCVNTQTDNASSSGYLVYPSFTNGKKLPAVIMIHEWWGINDNIRSMANALAKQGYVVLAADLFKGQSAEDPNRAMQLVKIVSDNPEQSISNLQAAVNYLSSIPFVDSSKIASIGWCFGGGQSLQLALHSDQHPLVATILYYGTPLVTDTQQLSKIKWPVLGIFGDKDQAIPLSNIQQFKAALDSDKITNEIHIYKGLGHAFANPSGANYAPNETIDAWQKTLEFLKKYM
jgi:carboxymethylenebutenolidase